MSDETEYAPLKLNEAIQHCVCGHTKGDHKCGGGFNAARRFGVCLVPGCECVKFLLHPSEVDRAA